MCVNFLKYEVLSDEYHKRYITDKGLLEFKRGEMIYSEEIMKIYG